MEPAKRLSGVARNTLAVTVRNPQAVPRALARLLGGAAPPGHGRLDVAALGERTGELEGSARVALLGRAPPPVHGTGAVAAGVETPGVLEPPVGAAALGREPEPGRGPALVSPVHRAVHPDPERGLGVARLGRGTPAALGLGPVLAGAGIVAAREHDGAGILAHRIRSGACRVVSAVTGAGARCPR